MEAGRLDQRVIFQQAVTIRDPDGILIQGWQDRFTLWCQVRNPRLMSFYRRGCWDFRCA